MRKILIALALALTTTLGGLAVAMPTYAALNCSRTDLTAQEQIQCGSCGASGQKTCDEIPTAKDKAATNLSTTVKNILNVLSAVVGTVAVIMIVVGGFRYVTSGGKQESVSAAKNTILYAVIGLIVVAIAQIIVHFVINRVT